MFCCEQWKKVFMWTYIRCKCMQGLKKRKKIKFGDFTTADNNLHFGVVHDILDSIGSESLVEGDGDEIVVVADHLRDEPFRTVERPDAEGPPVQLGVAEDCLIEVHNTRTKGINSLVDLAVCLPGVSAVGLCYWVVGAMAQYVLVIEP